MTKKLSTILLWVLIAITAVVMGFFAFGGDIDATAEYVEPVYTNWLVNLMFAFVGLATLAVVFMVGTDFVIRLIANPKKALLSTAGMVGFIAVVAIIYVLAPGSEIEILGLDEVPSKADLKLVDAELYLMYILTFAALILMVLGNFAKKIK